MCLLIHDGIGNICMPSGCTVSTSPKEKVKLSEHLANPSRDPLMGFECSYVFLSGVNVIEHLQTLLHLIQRFALVEDH